MSVVEQLCDMCGVTIGGNNVEIAIKSSEKGRTIISQYQCILIGGGMVLKDAEGTVKMASFVSGEFNEVLSELLFSSLEATQEEITKDSLRRLSVNENLPPEKRCIYADLLEKITDYRGGQNGEEE